MYTCIYTHTPTASNIVSLQSITAVTPIFAFYYICLCVYIYIYIYILFANRPKLTLLYFSRLP